jgi:hypothetical protein
MPLQMRGKIDAGHGVMITLGIEADIENRRP